MSRMMRAANFNMGSIPSEQNYAARTISHSGPLNSHRKATGVSEGNRLMKGKGDYLSQYMAQVKWVQPKPVI